MRYVPILFLYVCLSVTTLPVNGTGAEDCTAVYGEDGRLLRLATGSPGELGLVENLAHAFCQREPVRLCWIKAGSGKSLQLLKDNKVDVVLVHAPQAEERAVREGWAAQHTLFGGNEYYIVGPPGDPANVASADSAVDAYRRIAETGSFFLSRADNSGTHQRELFIWRHASVQPADDWYLEQPGFMLESLRRAATVGAYFMTDSSTWIIARKSLDDLRILFHGDPELFNTYHGLRASRSGHVTSIAARFLEFLASDDGQALIAGYGREEFGGALYLPAEAIIQRGK